MTHLTPQLVCERVFNLSSSKDIKLVKRPWDRFRPDKSSWRLVPSSDLPYYKYAKLFFDWVDNKQSSILCGFQVEKGLGEELSSMYNTKRTKHFIMNETWDWYKVKNKINTREFFEILMKIGKFYPVKLILEGGYLTEINSFDPYDTQKLQWDKYSFLFDCKKENFILNYSNRSSFVIKLHDIKNIPDFIYALEELNKDPWLWIVISVCTELDLNSNKELSDIDKLYEHFLAELI